jgi:hypothetical protein
MRYSGREFGSENPSVIYVALRWKARRADEQNEKKMLDFAAKNLKCVPGQLRIYNLCGPSKDRGMTLLLNELCEVEETIRRIKRKIDTISSVRRVVIGGRSGPMPIVAVVLKLILPRIRIELPNHHRARAVNGGPFGKILVL